MERPTTMPLYREMDINLQLRDMGEPPLSGDEMRRLFFQGWSVKRCVEMTVKMRKGER